MQKNKFLLVTALLFIPSMVAAADNAIIKYPQPPKRGIKDSHTTIVSLRNESDGKELKELPKVDNSPVVVPPEISTVVTMNNADVNRIVCPVDIKDVVFLREKGISVKVTGKDAFVNFKFVKKGEKTLYATEPSEMYVVCGQDTYNLIVVPKSNIPPQTVRLSSGIDKRIKNNSELLGSLPFEKKILRIVKDVYTDQMADSYNVADIRKQIGNWQELTMIHKKNVDIEGEGLRVKEYEAVLKQGQLPFKLSEKIFTKKTFADNPVAISLEKHILRPGETVRIFVVEQRQEKLPKSLYRQNDSTELNPLDEHSVGAALEASVSEQEENKSSEKTEKRGGSDE